MNITPSSAALYRTDPWIVSALLQIHSIPMEERKGMWGGDSRMSCTKFHLILTTGWPKAGILAEGVSISEGSRTENSVMILCACVLMHRAS